MTKAEKNKIFELAMKYDFAAGIEPTDKLYQNCYRTIGHFDAMLTLMENLRIEDEYSNYVAEHEKQLEEWKSGKFYI